MIYKKGTWAKDDICMGCGNTVDYDAEVGFLVVTDKVSIWDAQDMKDELDKHIFCSECGTDIDKLHGLGMKRVVATIVSSSGVDAVADIDDDEVN
jgi:hypothetical protein